MYEDKTQDALQAEMLARMGVSGPVVEGAFYDRVTRGVAYLGAAVYRDLDRLLAIAFPARDAGEAILWRAADFGIEAKPGMRAESAGFVLTGKAGAEIPEGTAFVTASGLEYDTTGAAVIGEDGTATVTVRAAEVGARYNVDAGRIDRLLVSVPGLTGGSNPNPALGGMDEESTESVFDRLDDYRKRPATSGNIAQYEQWAREVDGVGDARAIDLWAGPGTVKVVLVDMEMQPVTEAVRQACAAYIEEQRPAGGVAVTVESAERVQIDISARVTLDTSATAESVRGALRAAMEAYLLTLTFRASQIVYKRVDSFLFAIEGVVDSSALTINGGAVNIPLGATQVPVLGTVEVTVDAAS